MRKKIAVLIRDRQGEALRMSVGVALKDDHVDIYVLGHDIEDTGENRTNLKMINAMKLDLYTNVTGNGGMKYISDEEIARRLPGYDHVIPY